MVVVAAGLVTAFNAGNLAGRGVSDIIVHSSATPATMDVTVEMIDRWHRQAGYNGIGYHYVITRDAKVHAARELHRDGAHTLGQNKTSIGICVAGGLSKSGNKPEMNFTPAQLQQLMKLIFEIKLALPDVKVGGHRDFNATACPSFDVRHWFATGEMLP